MFARNGSQLITSGQGTHHLTVYDTASAAIHCRGDMPDEVTALAAVSGADDAVHVAAGPVNELHWQGNGQMQRPAPRSPHFESDISWFWQPQTSERQPKPIPAISRQQPITFRLLLVTI